MTQTSKTNRTPLRKLRGVICPRCRYVTEAAAEGRLLRCPKHPDTILVSARALSEADGDPFLGMMVGDRFAVTELLGAGSMGTVYRARQEAMGRDVALKIVHSDRLADAQSKSRFQQEARATSLLSSPHTVTVFDFGEVIVDEEDDDPIEVDGSLFLAMELLDGESLGARLKRGGKLPPAEAVSVARQALSSLAEAHDKGVIHRDLKPDNLVLARDAQGEEICKVLDFGIAKVLTHQGGIDALETQAGTVFGTPRYMSPEQAQGKRLDARSDLYSLGVILYHMLLGRPPFGDSDAVVVMAHHIKTVPPRPTEADDELQLPRALEDLLMRVLDKNPDKRPQSAPAFIEALDALGPLDDVVVEGEVEESDRTSSTMTSEVAQQVGGSSRWLPYVAIAGTLALSATLFLSLGLGVAHKQLEEPALGASAGRALMALADHFAARAVESDRVAAEASAKGDQQPPPAPSSSAESAPKPAAKPRGYRRFDRP